MPEWESLTFLNLGLDLERKKWTSFRIIIFGDMYSFAYSILIGFEVDINFSICPWNYVNSYDLLLDSPFVIIMRNFHPFFYGNYITSDIFISLVVLIRLIRTSLSWNPLYYTLIYFPSLWSFKIDSLSIFLPSSVYLITIYPITCAQVLE